MAAAPNRTSAVAEARLRPLGRAIITTSRLAVTVRSSTTASTARPWAVGSRAPPMKLRRRTSDLTGARAVTAATRSPTTGSDTQKTPVVPATAAARPTVPVWSTVTATGSGGVDGAAPRLTIHSDPSAWALTGTSGRTASRRAA